MQAGPRLFLLLRVFCRLGANQHQQPEVIFVSLFVSSRSKCTSTAELSRKFKKQVLSRRDQGWCDQVLPSGMQQLLQEQDVGETLESARWNVSTIMEERGGFSMLRKLGQCHIDGMPQFKSTVMGVQEQRDEFMIFCNEFSCGLKSWYQKHRVGLGNLAN